MRRSINWVLGVLLGAGLAVLVLPLVMPTPAVADHVSEPTASITGLDLHLENYALNLPVPCGGEWPYPTVRVAMYVDAEAAPSEHFTGVIETRFQMRNDRGDLVWRNGTNAAWPHQNLRPHAVPGKFDASRLTNFRGLTDHPGLWRFIATVTGDESGAVFSDVCEFEVVE